MALTLAGKAAASGRGSWVSLFYLWNWVYKTSICEETKPKWNKKRLASIGSPIEEIVALCDTQKSKDDKSRKGLKPLDMSRTVFPAQPAQAEQPLKKAGAFCSNVPRMSCEFGQGPQAKANWTAKERYLSGTFRIFCVFHLTVCVAYTTLGQQHPYASSHDERKRTGLARILPSGFHDCSLA